MTIDDINRKLADASESSNPHHVRLDSIADVEPKDRYADVLRDAQGHRSRFSDSSMYDFVCVDCGATDGMGDYSMLRPCPRKL